MITVESQRAVRSAPVLPSTTTLGPVRIAVTSRDKALAIWQDVVGLDLISEDADALHLGAGGKELITLELGARTRFPDRSLGLYHVAIHVPTRADLAQMAPLPALAFELFGMEAGHHHGARQGGGHGRRIGCFRFAPGASARLDRRQKSSLSCFSCP